MISRVQKTRSSAPYHQPESLPTQCWSKFADDGQVWSILNRRWSKVADIGPKSVEFGPKLADSAPIWPSLGPILVELAPNSGTLGPNSAESGRTRPTSKEIRPNLGNFDRSWPAFGKPGLHSKGLRGHHPGTLIEKCDVCRLHRCSSKLAPGEPYADPLSQPELTPEMTLRVDPPQLIPQI